MFRFQTRISFFTAKRIVYTLVVLGVSLVLVFAYFIFKPIPQTKVVPQEVPGADALYRQADRSIEERVTDLLGRMSLEEKVGQMALVEKNSVHNNEDIATYGIGALLSGAGAKPEDNTEKGWHEMVRSFTDTSRRSRLGIPILYGVDAIHGHSNLANATIFPHSIGLGATGNEGLVKRVARATAEELVATGVYWSFSPTLDLPQDIRWGRTYEAFSDDPVLVTQLGRAYMEGLQETDVVNARGSTTLFVLSTPKHYIGAGGMAWGSSSNKNFHIDQGTTPPSESALRDVYLPPFAEVVKRGAESIMVGLNSWGDTKLSADTYLVTDVLKDELGFTGFTVSDWYGVYEIPGGDYRAAVTAINAGIDMVMLPFDYQTFIKNVTRAVRKGEIQEARIDDAVARILRVKFSLGLFDSPRSEGGDEGLVGTSEHRSLAREAVAESLVLLKNAGHLLPITQQVKHIRVAGSAADNVGRQSGAWTVEWQGINGNWLPGSTSILEGIKKRAGVGVDVEYDLHANFENDTERADLGIAVVGEAPYAEGWGDDEEPALSPADLATISRLKAVCKKVVVIIVSGRPLLVSTELPSWDALIAAWLPGSEGAGVADVLFGDKPFKGRLPLPWPDHIGQLPITENGHTRDNTLPLFPRYFGL